MTFLGYLSISAFPWDSILALTAGFGEFAAAFAVVAWIVLSGRLPYLWKEWITSVDHKRIGVMYILLGLVMMLRGFADALLMRSQQMYAYHSGGYLPPHHYDQIFSSHGTIMIFFAAMPLMIGIMNIAIPLQLGARDVAFPTWNSTSLWLTASGGLLVNISLLIGVFSRAGWWPIPPLSEHEYSPDVGVDYWLWAIIISGAGTLATGVNFTTTILKMRAPGMGYLRMPMFCWTALAMNLLIVAAFPILTATSLMLVLDRYLGFHFFTNAAGGNMMMFVNLFWAWGHPEVYILVLPAFGIFSETITAFSDRPLFGYRSMVLATMGICIISFMVWVHHFFTMGAGGDVNATFGIASEFIAVVTGVKVFNWIATMYGGRISFATPMLWSLGFLITFVFGGMTGVMLAVPPADWMVHNSLFLVAHFHNTIISATIFSGFAGIAYWFPKVFGFRLHEGWGKAAFGFTVFGFYAVFVPLYISGILGMTRRLQHYDVEAWRPWVMAASVGMIFWVFALISQIIMVIVSIRRRRELRDETGDPWNGRSIEWATASPAPEFNFPVQPRVENEEPYIGMKGRAIESLNEQPYQPIFMPKSSPSGILSGALATILGFAMVWHIWWLAILAVLAAFGVLQWLAWLPDNEKEISAEEVADADRRQRRIRAEWLARNRPREKQR